MRGQRHTPAALYPGKEPVPIVEEAGWAPGPVWTGAENLAATGIRSPDRPARSQWLYRPCYPAHIACKAFGKRNFASCTVHTIFQKVFFFLILVVHTQQDAIAKDYLTVLFQPHKRCGIKCEDDL